MPLINVKEFAVTGECIQVIDGLITDQQCLRFDQSKVAGVAKLQSVTAIGHHPESVVLSEPPALALIAMNGVKFEVLLIEAIERLGFPSEHANTLSVLGDTFCKKVVGDIQALHGFRCLLVVAEEKRLSVKSAALDDCVWLIDDTLGKNIARMRFGFNDLE